MYQTLADNRPKSDPRGTDFYLALSTFVRSTRNIIAACIAWRRRHFSGTIGQHSATAAQRRNGVSRSLRWFLRSFRVAARHTCRIRNNQSGAKVSEHGWGRVIEIAGVQLTNGAEISVLKGWNAPETRKPLRGLHTGSCGPFVPNANRFDQDNFYFDTALDRSRSYCR
jgi:hypothetical protein